MTGSFIPCCRTQAAMPTVNRKGRRLVKAIRIKRWMKFTGYASVLVGLLAGPLTIIGANAWLIFCLCLAFCVANLSLAFVRSMPS